MDKASKLLYPESDFRRLVITSRELLQFQTRQYSGDFGIAHVNDDNKSPWHFPNDVMYRVASISFVGDATSVDFVSSKIVNQADFKSTYRLLKTWALDHDITIVYRLVGTTDVWVVNSKLEGLMSRYVNFDGVHAGVGTDLKWAAEVYAERERRSQSEQGDEAQVVLFDFANRAEY